MIATLVTTYRRPEALERSLPQISALGAPVLVIDDGSPAVMGTANAALCREYGALYIGLPRNRGLAAALNIGLSFWLADKSIDWISYFQDDVDVHPKALEVLSGLQGRGPILTGHDAPEHRHHDCFTVGSVRIKHKWSCRATHMHASEAFWRSVLPLPTNELGTPKRVEGRNGRGIGSNVDWWIVRDAPGSCQKTHQHIVCVPHLVRTFLWQAEYSCWNNLQRTGEEPELATYF